MKKRLTVLLVVLFFISGQAVASEEQAGLNYWNNIDKEVVETASGLKYKALIVGEGRKPEARDKVTVHYRGLLLNGVEFDSSFSGD